MPGSTEGGIFFSLLTESFAVRALVGTLVAAVLVVAALRAAEMHNRTARRLLVLAPLLTALAVAVVSVDEAFLPQLLRVSAATGHGTGMLLDVLRGNVAGTSPETLFGVAYALVAGTLLARRAAGGLAVRRLLATATPLHPSHPLAAVVTRLALAQGLRPPRVLVADDCPGGACTAGIRRPVLVFDKILLTRLDDHERDGVVAHELAHVRRRDTFVGLVVGVLRDLLFFLPAVVLATRWLYREQEEGADASAAEVTGRPYALASGILKVWDAAAGRPRAAGTCAVVPSPAAGPLPAGRLSDGARVVAARVERLLDGRPARVTSRRRQAEAALVAAVVSLATVVAIRVPAWVSQDLGTYSLYVGYMAAQPAPPAESPAMATFKVLAPAPVQTVLPRSGPAAGPVAPASDTSTHACLCVETQAQLRAGVAAAPVAPPRALRWPGSAQDAEQAGAGARPTARALPLWTSSQEGSEVGFFRGPPPS